VRELVDHANGQCFEIETTRSAEPGQSPEVMKYPLATAVKCERFPAGWSYRSERN